MADTKDTGPVPPALSPETLAEAMQQQAHAARAIWGQFLPGASAALPHGAFPGMGAMTDADTGAGQMADWAAVAEQIQSMWSGFQAQMPAGAHPAMPLADPQGWGNFVQSWWREMPIADPARQQALWAEGFELWQGVMGRFIEGNGTPAADELPRKDRRFRDDKWREQPVFALIHQTYLLFAERIGAMVDEVQGLDPDAREKLRFATRTIVEAASPAHLPMTNPVVLEKTLASGGQNLVKGMEHLIADLQKGQLTHTDPDAFVLGENLATTQGKVVHETPLYQLIQYAPATDKVTGTPLVIFPPWINRFYILDLTPEKSFVRWAVEQGVTVFMVSWKSADASHAEVVWDDYIAAQIDAIDHVRARLDVPAVHTIGYCVAGTTLAATLSVLTARGEADKVRSATFFTAQVDFEKSGELRMFVDDTQLGAIGQLGQEGFVDGRYLAATFNMLRSTDLVWNYVVNNYLLGEDYPAFDLLHWNGDVTNLPAKWHQDYLRDLYRDNRLVEPGSLSALGVDLDLTRVQTPTFVQAGREDHIAPAASVFKLREHFSGPVEFMLAGSGHIAGVVNPPAAGKYQYWTNHGDFASLDDFVATAEEHPGSWWPYWMEWLRGHDGETVPATGKRKPGGKGDSVIEDAPGRYVATR